MEEQIEDLELLMMLTTEQPDLNAPAPEEASVGGDGPRMEGPSVSTPVITMAEAVAAPAAQSSSAAPMSMPRLGSAKHVKFWEMNETGDVKWQGMPCITGLQGYRNSSLENPVPNLPQTMDIVQLHPMDTLKSRCTGDCKWLPFRAKELHEVLAKMQNENSYAEIQLPSQTQTLLLCVCKQPTKMVGILLHEQSDSHPQKRQQQQSDSHPQKRQQRQPHSQRRQLQIAAQPNQQQPAAHIKHQQVAQRQQNSQLASSKSIN